MRELRPEVRIQLYQTFWETYGKAVEDLAREIRSLFQEGRRLFVAGNGGSAAQADHLVAELVGRFHRKRNAYPAVLLGGSLATLTALSNDFGYEEALAFELEALSAPGDGLLALTTSGKSPNILRLLEVARDRNVRTFVLTGERGRDLPADRVIAVPSLSTPLIQEVHLQILHTLASFLEGEG